jgi:hypothetical protein
MTAPVAAISSLREAALARRAEIESRHPAVFRANMTRRLEVVGAVAAVLGV